MVGVPIASTWGTAEEYSRAMESPSIVALKTATLLASPFVELVLRESPVGEHATCGCR